MRRLLFEKTGNAIWISHLDLMRLFQRAFKRAGLLLKHTQGFNPRPSVSIALPLSVGVQSKCELLDFELEGCTLSGEEIRTRLNACLVEGVTVLDVYESGRKIRDLSLLQCKIVMEYDNPVSGDTAESVENLFRQTSLVVPKKTKNGMQDQNIIPLIRAIAVKQAGEMELQIDALICCQNPTLNPAQLALAVCMHLPELQPSFTRCYREEVFDCNEVIFR